MSGIDNYLRALQAGWDRTSPQAINNAIYETQLAKSNTRRLPSEEEQAIATAIYNTQLAKSKGRQLPSAEQLSIGQNESNLRRLPSAEDKAITGNVLDAKTNIFDTANLDRAKELERLNTERDIELNPYKLQADKSNYILKGNQDTFDNYLLGERDMGKAAGYQANALASKDATNVYNLANKKALSTLIPQQTAYDKAKLESGITEFDMKKKISDITKNMDPIDASVFDRLISGKGDVKENLLYLNQLKNKYPELAVGMLSAIKETYGIPMPLQSIELSDIEKAMTKYSPANNKFLNYTDSKGNTRRGRIDGITGRLVKDPVNDTVIRTSGTSGADKRTLNELYYNVHKAFKLIQSNDEILKLDKEGESGLYGELKSAGVPDKIINRLDPSKSNMINKKILEKYFRETQKTYGK